MSAAPDIVARGDRAALGPVRLDLAATYARWLNDPEVKVGILRAGLYTPEDQRRFIEESQQAGAQRDPGVVSFTIYDAADEHPVGQAALFDISWRHRRAELGINLGERRGTGIGGDAARLLCDWAFNVLSLNSVYLTVLDFNTRAQRSYERAGFRVIGRRREAILARGRLCDEVLMDMLAADFGPSRVAATEL